MRTGKIGILKKLIRIKLSHAVTVMWTKRGKRSVYLNYTTSLFYRVANDIGSGIFVRLAKSTNTMITATHAVGQYMGICLHTGVDRNTFT